MSKTNNSMSQRVINAGTFHDNTIAGQILDTLSVDVISRRNRSLLEHNNGVDDHSQGYKCLSRLNSAAVNVQMFIRGSKKAFHLNITSRPSGPFIDALQRSLTRTF